MAAASLASLTHTDPLSPSPPSQAAHPYNNTSNHGKSQEHVQNVAACCSIIKNSAVWHGSQSYFSPFCSDKEANLKNVTGLRWKALNNKDMFESSSGSSSRLGCVVTSRNNDCGSSARDTVPQYRLPSQNRITQLLTVVD
ncbi:hypothetical protein JZ751_007754 [Albula glossodonta]|uniref:Uncharacterized protein n=1 Tax=Albula glossodonta TaxID=121402 RepID=A0A8T2P0S7_9TELE|nr:hypothetical protein JZ751_007754 [Albula glossodonta]